MNKLVHTLWSRRTRRPCALFYITVVLRTSLIVCLIDLMRTCSYKIPLLTPRNHSQSVKNFPLFYSLGPIHVFISITFSISTRVLLQRPISTLRYSLVCVFYRANVRFQGVFYQADAGCPRTWRRW